MVVHTESEEAVEAFSVQYETGSDAEVSRSLYGIRASCPSDIVCLLQLPARALRPQTIALLANAALLDIDRVKRRALHAFIYARLHFTPMHQVGRILQLADQYKAGVRGYDVGALGRNECGTTHSAEACSDPQFPMPFSLKCREYEDGLKPGWCAENATTRR